jgi:hypothetical protein
MVKQHPVASEEAKDIEIKKRQLDSFVEELSHKIESDMHNRHAHMTKLTHYMQRRYQELGKDRQWPWVGASNWRSPVIDAEVNKAKAPLMAVYNADPICSFVPMSVNGVDKSDAAEQTMQWLLKSRMRNFKAQMERVADTGKQGGYGIAKITYEYQTQVVKETIRVDEMEDGLLLDIVSALTAVEEGQSTQEDFDIELSVEIANKFNLNIQDEIDGKAIKQLMPFVVESARKLLDESLVGDEEITIMKNEVWYDAPRVENVDLPLFIPETGVMDLQDAERITEVMFQTANELRTLARDGYYDKKMVEEILKAAKDSSNPETNQEDFKGEASPFADLLNSEYEQARAQREGLVLTENKDLFRVHNVYCMYDIDGDGVKEKCLLIYHHGTGKKLRFMEFPYEHGKWPFVQYRNEEADGRFYSPRGVAEQIDQIDELITENRRAKINQNRIVNQPTFKVKLGSSINANNLKWRPGGVLTVHNMNDIEVMQMPSRDFSFDNEEQILQFWVERVLGSTDLALQSKGGSEARTRAEINVVAGIGQQATSMSVERWQRFNKEVYEQIWALWLQYGPTEFVISQSLGQIKPLSRHEIQGRFDLQPTGTAGEVNPDQKFIRAQQRLQTILALQEQGVVEQLEREFEINIGAAFMDMMNSDDFLRGSKILRRRSEEEIAQIDEQLAQQQQAQAQQQQIENNQPVPITDLQATLKQIKKDSPNGGAQQVAL